MKEMDKQKSQEKIKSDTATEIERAYQGPPGRRKP